MENQLRAALLDWLRADPTLSSALNSIAEEPPPAASAPWLALVASAAADWGSKTEKGREIRLALELNSRADNVSADIDLVQAIEARIDAFPSQQSDFTVASARFLRGRAERRPRNLRAVLLEYRFRILAT